MIIQLAVSSDITSIILLIQMRIKWMNEQGINQWNKSNYLTTFSLEYFDDVIENKQLYVVKTDSDEIIGAFTLFEQDRRWIDGVAALYIHNFVSHIKYSGVGNEIIAFCSTEAKRRNLNLLRIDCQQENAKLNEYYCKHGFEYVSSFNEELYCGNRREKRVNER